jgi:predicted secreted hydrolase
MISREALGTRAAAAAVGLAAALAMAATAADRWLPARADYAWSFPRDHWAHPGYRTEWWYFTGFLESPGPPPRRFGYQFTFFRVGLAPDSARGSAAWAARNLVMGHAAIGDFARREHRFSEVLYREVPMLGAFGTHPDPRIAASRSPAGTDGEWTLTWNGKGFDLAAADSARRLALRLTTTPQRPLVFQGPGGLSAKGRAPGEASQYYSFTRLATEGTLALDGRTWRVRGRSWMDREFGSNQLAPGQVGWDWFSLALDDGRDLMLYLLRRADGSVDHRSATLVGADGEPRYLASADWSVRATATWKSPATGAVYPSRWLVEIPGARLRLEIEPVMPDQENRSALTGGLFYWEGAVTARAVAPPAVTARAAGAGAELGRGYVELTGYGKGNRPPL